jgi:hypothetical protein
MGGHAPSPYEPLLRTLYDESLSDLRTLLPGTLHDQAWAARGRGPSYDRMNSSGGTMHEGLLDVIQPDAARRRPVGV